MATTAPAAQHWFEYFPGHFMWSQGMMWAMDLIAWGGCSLGEAHQVGLRLRGKLGDNEAWHAEWTSQAERLERWADEEAARGHQHTAGGQYLRAATYHFVGEIYIPPGDGRKLASFKRMIGCFAEGAKRLLPRLERVEIPYEGTFLPAYFMPAEGDGPYRTMVFFGGLDGTKEMSTPVAAVELSRRGVACLVVDGPGQGETLRLRGIPSRYDYEVPAAAAVDYLESRPDVDGSRIGIMAVSMGGYYAPRAAAFEKRLKLCVAWGAHFDYHAVWLHRRQVQEAGGSAVSAPAFQLPWVLGVGNMDEAVETLRRYTLAGVAEQITCPLLVLHGGQDTIVPVAMAHRLYEAAGSKEKDLRIFTAEDGSAEHGMRSNWPVAVAYLADWIADRL